MIDVSNEVKQAYDISTTQIDKIIADSQEYKITNVQYYDDVYEEGNIIGTAIARCLEFEIENIVDLEGKEVEYLTGIKVNNSIEWISLGNFIIQDVEPNDTTNINKVTAMDYMLKTNTVYNSALNYANGKVTLLQVMQEACTNSNLLLATTDFVNMDFIVDSNQFIENTLNRQVIQAVAQISGTVAKIKNDNKLYLINPNEVTNVSKVFTLNNYEEAEIKRNTHPINLVSLGMKDIEGENITLRDEESINKNGENSLVINDNPFAYTQAKREQLITALFNAIKGFEYKSYTFKCQGLPYLETMDKVQFKDKEGNTYDSYVFRFNYKSPNGLESTIEAPSIIKATVNYQNVLSALDIAKRTEILVDKQNQTITQLVQETSEHEQKLTQQQQTLDGINAEVSNIKTNLEENYTTTEETQSMINVKADEVSTTVSESTTSTIMTLLNNGYLTTEQVNALVNGNAEDIATVKEQLKQTVTSTQMQIEITKAIESGVSYLKNTLFTIDENGMTIATNQDEFNALYNNKGMYLYSYDELIARYDKDGAYLKNLRITGELETSNLRIMDVTVNGEARTHIHWIGG